MSPAPSSRAVVRIAFCIPRASLMGPAVSGDSVFIDDLVTQLRERGHEVEIVSSVDVRGFWDGGLPARRLVGELRAARRFAKRFAPDAWLVYGASLKNPDLLGWWQRPKRYVLVYADFRSGKDMPRHWRWVFGVAHRRSLARADWVAAWRPKALDAVRSGGVAPERLFVMPSAVPVPEQTPSQEDARRHLQLPLGVPIILSVSRLSKPRTEKPWKTEWMLELLRAVASAQLPADAFFLLVGDGRGRPRIEEELGALGVGDKIRLAGSASREDLRWYYAACDLFAYAALTDRVFLTILEAQAFGRPVVTLRSRSTELIVQDGETGLLADDLANLEVRLTELATDRERCASMGRAAREYVATNHSMETRVREIEELLVGSPSRPLRNMSFRGKQSR